MIPRFERCVRAIAETAVERAVEARADPVVIGRAGDYLVAMHQRMPDYLGLAFHAMTLTFDASAIIFHGRPFHLLSAGPRLARLQAWEGSPLGVMRSVMTFYTTFANFSLYSDYRWHGHRHDGAGHAVKLHVA